MAYTVRRKQTIGIQAGEGIIEVKNQGTQCEEPTGSYNRASSSRLTSTTNDLTYDELLQHYLCNTELTLQWLKDENLISASRQCPVCDAEMKWTKTHDRSDGYKWECRTRKAGKRHKTEYSIRENSWFEKSSLTIQEILKLTYWWCADLSEKQISKQFKAW